MILFRKERNARKLEEKIALTRIEQICPFPYDLVKAEILKYPNAELCWAQEEHKNTGAWDYVYPRIDVAAGDLRNPVEYAGRPSSASPATAVKPAFAAETEQYINKCLGLNQVPSSSGVTSPTKLKPPAIQT